MIALRLFALKGSSVNPKSHRSHGAINLLAGTYQESCPLGVLELNTFLKLTSI
jgi:hypothetical protein